MPETPPQTYPPSGLDIHGETRGCPDNQMTTYEKEPRPPHPRILAMGCGVQYSRRDRRAQVQRIHPTPPLEEALVLLAQAEEARAEADADLDAVLAQLGFTGWRGGIG